jgi:uncharacterized protein (TIGR03067 family)
MKVMRLWPLLALLALPAARPGAGVSIQDLQGVWTGARFTEGRGENPEQGVKLDFVVKDRTIRVVKASGAPVGDAVLSLAEDGRSIDADGTSGGYRNKTYLGIVAIEGGTLRWCINGTAGKDRKRPDGFAADPGAAQYLIVATKRK